MSPFTRTAPRSEPSHVAPVLADATGTISAMGWPRLVTRTDWPVWRTFSSTERQVALKCEILMVSISSDISGYLTMEWPMVNVYGQLAMARMTTYSRETSASSA